MKILQMVLGFLSILLFFLLILLYSTPSQKKLQSMISEKIKKLKLYNSLVENYKSINYPVYYINMDKDTERNEFMKAQLSRVCNNYKRICGVNGKLIKNILGDSIPHENNIISFLNDYEYLTKSEIGCVLSHIYAIKKAYEDGNEIALILEDDALLDTYNVASDLQDILKEAPSDWEIIQTSSIAWLINNDYKDIPTWPLFLFKERNRIKYNRDVNGNIVMKDEKINPYASNCSYIVNRKGMQKLLQHANKGNDNMFELKRMSPNFPTRGAADDYILDILKTYTLLPCLFIPINIELESTIHPEDTYGHLLNALIHLKAIEKTYNNKQAIFTLTLLDFNKIANEGFQPYFLVSGTLLGAIRDKGFIEYDHDIDVGIMAEKYIPNILEKIKESFHIKKTFVKENKLYEITLEHKITKVKLDIFLYYKNKDKIILSTFTGKCDKKPKGMCEFVFTPFSLRNIKFIGKEFLVPDNTDLYLSELYGDWRKPSKFSYNEGIDGKYKNIK